MDLCFDALLHSVMIRYILSTPGTECNKGMHTSWNWLQQVRTRAQNAIYLGDKKDFNSIPWLTLSHCLQIEIRAKHDQLIDWVGPTQPPV